MIILSIETSCDETSIAILKNGKILSNVVSSQIKNHMEYGGIVPEIASRLHLKNLNYVLQNAIKTANIHLTKIDYIAYTVTPGLIGCLQIGKIMAKTLASYLKKPLIPCNHLEGHIYGAAIEQKFKFPLIALLVSGGHTQLILMKKHLDFKLIGDTKDDAAGECFDKVGRMLGLDYPAGSLIEKNAKNGQAVYKLPLPKDDKSFDFSFSGLKSACSNLIKKEKDKNKDINIKDFCFSLQETIIAILIKKLKLAVEIYQVKMVVLSGGVSSNQQLRNKVLELSIYFKNLFVLIPKKLEYCTDNGAMIANLAFYKIKYKSLINKNIQFI